MRFLGGAYAGSEHVSSNCHPVIVRGFTDAVEKDELVIISVRRSAGCTLRFSPLGLVNCVQSIVGTLSGRIDAGKYYLVVIPEHFLTCSMERTEDRCKLAMSPRF